MDKIKESYYNLLMIASSIRTFYISKIAIQSYIMEAEEQETGSTYPDVSLERHFEIQSYAVKGIINIQLCAFLDEYSYLFSLKTEEPESQIEAELFKEELRSLLGPIIKMINKYWKDLRKERNQLLAHNWRNGKDAIMFSSETEKPQNIPWVDEEFTLIIGTFDLMIGYMKEIWSEYFNEMHSLLLQKDKSKVHHLSPVTTHKQSLEKLEAVDSMLKAGKEYISCLRQRTK